jgi:DNA-directed RNA polymerase specialized sigma24 family protein
MGEDDIEQLKALYAPLRRFAGIIAPAGVAPDDLVQEVFTRVVERGGFAGVDNPVRYLRRALVNLVSNERRHFQASQRAFSRHGLTADERAPVYPSDLAELMRIDPRARLLTYLVDVEGASIAEAADLAGCTQGAARMQLSRTRRQLRNLLEEHDAHTA